MLKALKTFTPRSTRTKIIDYFYSTPPIIRLGKLFNRLGGNVIRNILFQCSYILRKKPTVSNDQTVINAIKTLEKEGIVSIENFLSEKEFSEIEAEYESLYPEFRESTKIKIPIQKRIFMSKSRLEACEHTKYKNSKFHQFLLNNERLNSIISSCSKRKLNIAPTGQYSEETYPAEKIGQKSQSKVVNPHYDIHYHSYKAFLYISDVDKTNGAFRYSLGSNRFSARRLLLEYYTSINMAESKNMEHVNFSQSTFFKEYENSMTSMIGKKNTLVIFDAKGIHQRGNFSSDKPRRMAQISYRHLESLANKHISLIDRIVKL